MDSSANNVTPPAGGMTHYGSTVPYTSRSDPHQQPDPERLGCVERERERGVRGTKHYLLSMLTLQLMAAAGAAFWDWV